MSRLETSQYRELPGVEFSLYEWSPTKYALTTRDRRHKVFLNRIVKDVKDLYPIKVSLFHMESGRPEGDENYTINGKHMCIAAKDLIMIDITKL